MEADRIINAVNQSLGTKIDRISFRIQALEKRVDANDSRIEARIDYLEAELKAIQDDGNSRAWFQPRLGRLCFRHRRHPGP